MDLEPKRLSRRERERKAGETLSHSPDTAQRIMAAATKLFAQRGFEGTSVKHISDAAGVNVAAISYHFRSKEDLYIRIIQEFGEARTFRHERILHPVETYAEFALVVRYLLVDMMESFAERRDAARMVLTEAQNDRPICAEVFQKTFGAAHLRAVGFFTDCIARGIIAANIDPEVATTQLFGGMSIRIMTGCAFAVNGTSLDLSLPEEQDRIISGTLALLMNGMKPR